ncbi:hypothetical protein J7I84_16840 [Arthrobacter sp. ISL-85]|uniref:hypothetical protein n=1 Tax=Arthrobacter sp. ISL-85 TaxID=2819115 RepID=UPI001BE5AB0E|nr:hypothetical protein [Arthrobacter sp. ISL-85]MBT2568135.1 hypothetical protein [Arthrobacter sp. ISL-85]
MAGSYKINPSAIKKMTQDIQREFDKNPIQLPVNADSPAFRSGDVYNGPVINVQGDNTQLAWDNRDVQQSNTVNPPSDIAAGFEPLSEAVVRILKEVHASGLDPEDIAAVEEAGKEILDEVTKQEPEQGRIKRAVTYMKGLLAPLVIRIAESAAEGAGEGAHDWAATALDVLSQDVGYIVNR